uniref:N-acyl-aliphatic-L-amino acid amidohydrolase n=1 Tax=Steinernema glaseri TaxID=37863 RepID=A0A1I7ZBA8_9BILA
MIAIPRFSRFLSLRQTAKGFSRLLASYANMSSGDQNEDIAVTNFRRYIRVNTEQPTPNYAECKDFLFGLGKELGFECHSHECVPGKPIVWLTKKGTDPTRKSLMLYSHTDVVPTFKDKWTYDPYAAVKDAEGRIYGRGTQDMKCVGIQYVEALRRLMKDGKANFLRTVHVVFGPDEEVGGADGMEKFVETEHFKNLNIGFSLDEGIANPTDHFKVYYAERCPWWIKVTCPGSPGHGSRFLENTPAEKLQRVINSFLEWREEQKAILEANSDSMNLGDITSCNLTKVDGGVQLNVIPAEMNAYFDIRVTPRDDYEELEKKIQSFCEKAGKDVTYSFLQKAMIKNMTPIDDADPWWSIFSSVLKKNNLDFKTEIFVGATDSRFLRRAGYKAIGFSPMKNTPTLLHDHDEFLTEDEYLRGVEIYEKLIVELANNEKD